MSVADLLEWNRLSGEYYGSEDQSIFFYSYCKMQCPETVLELGTGLGHTALWMAQALKENGQGHVWTIDNGVRWPELLTFLTDKKSQIADAPRFFSIFSDAFDLEVLASHSRKAGDHFPEYFRCMERLAAAQDLSPFVSFLEGTLSLTDADEVTSQAHPFLAPALDRPIDLLYADFDHYPHAVLTLLTKYLPLMSECSSIFVDSAATYLPSYLTLERTVDQLNQGKLPAIFFAGTTSPQRERLAEIVATRRFLHIALPERKNRNQNGLAWIKIEPVNILPYPLTQLRGFFSAPVPGSALKSLFETGRLPEKQIRRSFLFEQFVRAAYPLTEEELRFLLALMAGRNAS